MATSPYLTGQLLLAMPGMADPRFFKSVIFLCLHDEKGALGLRINDPIPGLLFGPLMEQLDLAPESAIAPAMRGRPIFTGGPVESSRGFVLHDDSYDCKDTIRIGDHFSLTSTTDGLKEIAASAQIIPSRFILGYAGWEAGQLEKELQDNTWMTLPPTAELVFEADPSLQWDTAFAMLGVNPAILSTDAGRA